jgi:tetratricopeptide (TPR) repeat protein
MPRAIWSTRWLALLVLPGRLLGPADAAAQATNPPYLAQFPSTGRMRAELRGSDPVDSSARVMAAWMQLMEIIRTLSGPRYASMRYTADENRVTSEYGSAWQRGLHLENLPAEKDRSRWNRLRAAYEKDPGFLDELLRRVFPAEFRLAYYQALGRPAPQVVAAEPARPAAPSTPAPAPTPSALDRRGAATLAAGYLANGDRLRNSRDYAKAIEAYQNAIRLDPPDSVMARAQSSLGISYMGLEQYQSALPAFQAALKLEPDNLETRSRLGLTYYALEQYSAALTVLQEVVRREADYLPGHLGLGDVYLALERFPEASAAYQQAIRLEPSRAEARYSLATTYLDMGRKEDALALVEPLRKLNPAQAAKLSRDISFSFKIESDDAEDNLLLGRSFFYEGLDSIPGAYRFALRAFRRVLVLKPSPDTLAEAHAWIGRVYQEQRRYEKAAAAFQEAIRLKPRDAEYHFRLGMTYLAMDREDQALEVQQTLKAIDKGKADALLWEILNRK